MNKNVEPLHYSKNSQQLPRLNGRNFVQSDIPATCYFACLHCNRKSEQVGILVVKTQLENTVLSNPFYNKYDVCDIE